MARRRLDIESARAAGYSDQEIQSFVASNPDIELSAPMEPTQPSFLETKKLPMAMAAAGGLVGSAVPGPGTFAGGGLGYGVGEMLRRIGLELQGKKGHPESLGQFTTDVALPAVGAGAAASTLKTLGSLGFAPFRDLLASKATGQATTAPILEAGKQYVQRDPFATNALKTVAGSLPEKLSASELVKQLQVWGRAYKGGGDVKATAIANLFNSLYGPGRQALAQLSPAASYAQSGLHTMSRAGNLVRQLLLPAAVSGAIYAGLGKLGRALE